MASYQSVYDPNSYVTHGYELPNKEIMGALQARSQYYLQSAQQIKNSYDQTFDFNLSNESNRQSLQTMKDQADQQLKGVLKNDLSIGEYSSQAQNIFKPIATNKDFIADEQFTNQIHTGLQQAQTDMKKLGADHFNMKSVQVMKENLQDWSKADPKDIDLYSNDILGTTYQPYDPKVDKDFQKQLTDRIKNGKIKKEYSDGQGHLITTEYADLNSQQAQEWIKEIRPQQSQIQDQLDARIYANRLRKSSPEERQQLLSHVEAVQNYNIAKQVSYIQTEKNKMDMAYQLSPAEDQIKNKDIYAKRVQEYNDNIEKTKSQYKDFDNTAYFNPYMKNVAHNQLETLLNQRSINGLVDGLGLEQTSQTIKTDQGYWNQKNIDFNEKKLLHEDAYRTQKLALDTLKATTEKAAKLKPVLGTPNPNEQAAPALADIGTSALTEEDKQIVAGKQVQTQLKGEPEVKQSSGIAALFDKLNIKVNKSDGFGTENFFTALDNELKTNPNGAREPLSTLIDRVAAGDEQSKKLIYALMQKGAEKRTNGNLYKEATLPNVTLWEVKKNMKAAMSDPAVFNAAVKKAGVDASNLDAAYQIGYQNASIAYDEKTQENNYGSVYKNTAKAFIPNADKKSFKELRDYDEDQYIADIAPELKVKGYADKDIANLKLALKENKPLEDRIMVASPTTLTGSVPFMSNQDYSKSSLPSLREYKEKWDNYQKTLNVNLAKKSSGASNYNTLGYSIVDKSDVSKSFDPSVNYNISDFKNLILNNSTGANVAGETQDGKYLDKVKALIRSNPKIVDAFHSYSDGNETFLTLDMDRNAQRDKLISDVGLKPEDLINTKIYIDNTGRKNIGFKDQSPSAMQLKHGKVFGATTLSGKSFSYYNVGNDDIQLKFNGSIMMPTVDPTGKGFQVKEVPLATLVNSPNPPITEQQLQLAGDDAGKFLYGLDGDATRISDILKKYHIDPSGEKFISWADLPKEAKAELKKVRTTFQNFTD